MKISFFSVRSSFESWKCPLIQVKSLLDYCMQLSTVGVLQLEPLTVLQGCCVLLDSQTLKQVSLICSFCITY